MRKPKEIIIHEAVREDPATIHFLEKSPEISTIMVEPKQFPESKKTKSGKYSFQKIKELKFLDLPLMKSENTRIVKSPYAKNRARFGKTPVSRLQNAVVSVSWNMQIWVDA